MQDLGETLLDVVVAMAATSYCFMGVALKADAHAQVQAPKAQPAVVRRVPAPRQPARVIAVRDDKDCPEAQRA
jgi:hypothetical protein